MLESGEFRQLLVADLALVRGVASARDVAAAIQRYWEDKDKRATSLVDELAHIAQIPREALVSIEAEVDAIVLEAGGDPRLALTRRRGLDRSLHAALAERDARLSHVLTQVGAGARAPLRSVPDDRYIDFLVAGEGGMGVVYMALDTELNRLVAFKMVRPDAGSGTKEGSPATPIKATRPPRDTPASQAFEELKARFLQEAWVTGGLEHPGVVPVYELGQTPHGIPYYTMRFVRGQRTLKQAMDEVRTAPFEDRLKLLEPFLKICDTLAYAHSKGVIHRDLKPDNVALGEFGEVVLLDWGLAKLEGKEDLAASRWQERVREFRDAGDLRTIAGAIGTPGYMAPEAALGQIQWVDKRTDVYSLGALLFELLTGRLPHEFKTYSQYMDRVANEDAPLAREIDPDVPDALSDLCARCLSRDRTERPEHVEDVTRALRSWQAASAIEREVLELLRDARTTLDVAESASADVRLQQVDRAAAALAQVRTKLPDHERLQVLEERAAGLRELGIQERERRVRRRIRFQAAAAILVLGLAGFGYYLLQPAGLRVESDPTGARMLLDGREVGATPIDLAELTPGDHELVLEKPGFNTLELPVSLERAGRRDLTLRLVPSTGTLYATSDPSELAVRILDESGNEIQTGETPLLLTLPKGDYRAVGSAALYADTEEQFVIRDDGRPTRLHMRPTLIGSQLMLDAHPLGTLVQLRSLKDELTKDLVAPFTAPVLLPPGDYELTASSRNHFPRSQTISLEPGRMHQRLLTLRPMRVWTSLWDVSRKAAPVIADVDADGWLDVVLTGTSGAVAVVEGLNGRVAWLRKETEVVSRSAAVADVDLDGDLDVIVAGRSWDDDRIWTLMCLDGSTGEKLWTYDKLPEPYSEISIVPVGPAPHPLILVASRSYWFCFDGDSGRRRWHLPAQGWTQGRLLAADLDHDGKIEVVGQTTDFDIETGWTFTPTFVKCVDADTGRLKWEREFPRVSLELSPCLLDADRDGVTDVVSIGNRWEDKSWKASLHACSGKDGEILFSVDVPSFSAPDLAWDADSRRLYLDTDDGIYSFDPDSRTLERALPWIDTGISSLVYSDLDGDGSPEVLLSCTNHTLVAASLSTGERLWEYQTEGGPPGRACVADFDGDGALECLFSTRGGPLTCIGGIELPSGWRVRMPRDITATPAVADLDGDEFDDMVVPCGDGVCRLIRGVDGAEMGHLDLPSNSNVQPWVGDWDADGAFEIVLGCAQGEVVAYDATDGELLWQSKAEGSILCPPRIWDLDDDGAPEILIGDEECHVQAFRASDGSRLWKTARLRGPIRARFVCSREGEDRIPHIYCGTSGTDPSGGMRGANGAHYILDGRSGEILVTDLDAYVYERFSLEVDADGDGRPEVVTTDHGYIDCRDTDDCRSLWRYEGPSEMYRDDGYPDFYALKIGSSENQKVLIVTRDLGFCSLVDMRGRRELWTHAIHGSVVAPPALFDADGDGVQDVIVVLASGVWIALRTTDGAPVRTQYVGRGTEDLPPVALRTPDSEGERLAVVRRDGTIEILGRRSHAPYLTLPGPQDFKRARLEGRLVGLHPLISRAFRNGNHAYAATLLGEMPEVPPDSPHYPYACYWEVRAALEQDAGSKDEAVLETLETPIQHLLTIAPFLEDVPLLEAERLARLGREDDAIAILRGVVEKKPEYVLGWKHLARLLLERSRLEELQSVLPRYLQLRMGTRRAFSNYVRRLLEREIEDGNYEWALAQVDVLRARFTAGGVECLRPLIVALRDGEEAGKSAYDVWFEETLAASGEMYHQRRARESLRRFERSFADPDAGRRLRQHIWDLCRPRPVLVVGDLRSSDELQKHVEAGLLPNAIILTCDGQAVTTREELSAAIARAGSEGKAGITLEVQRDGKTTTVELPAARLEVPLQDRYLFDLPRLEIVGTLERAKSAYASESPLRTTARDARPEGMSWRACAKDFDAVLDEDPEGRLVRDDSRVSFETSAAAVLCYDAACVHSQAAKEAADDERDEDAESHAQRAVRLLDECLRHGWADAAHLLSDTDLVPLREREDYASVLRAHGIEEPAKDRGDG